MTAAIVIFFSVAMIGGAVAAFWRAASSL